jgi:hypothetical protein
MDSINSMANRDTYHEKNEELMKENAELKSKLQDSNNEIGRLGMVLKRQVDNLHAARRLGKYAR